MSASGELATRLRGLGIPVARLAADRIEALEAEVERLADSEEGWSRTALEMTERAQRLERRAEQAEASRDHLAEALRSTRPIVERWCHTQGNAPELFAQYLAPIDQALSTLTKQDEDNGSK